MSASISPDAREAAAALLLLVWRAWKVPYDLLWRDWFALLCVFWIFTALGSRSRAWPYVAGATMSGLLVLYSLGQVPQTLRVLNLLR